MSEAIVIQLHAEPRAEQRKEQICKQLKSKSKKDSLVIKAYLKAATKYFNDDKFQRLEPYLSNLPTAFEKDEAQRARFLVTRAISIVADELDEKDTKGIRATLNFGHTVGHAIEAAGKYSQYHHGESIALGMRVAASISRQEKLCKADDAAALNKLLSLIGLPEHIQRIKTTDIISHMKHDKKILSRKNRFILMQRIGKVKIFEGISLAVIIKAIQAYR